MWDKGVLFFFFFMTSTCIVFMPFTSMDHCMCVSSALSTLVVIEHIQIPYWFFFLLERQESQNKNTKENKEKGGGNIIIN